MLYYFACFNQDFIPEHQIILYVYIKNIYPKINNFIKCICAPLHVNFYRFNKNVVCAISAILNKTYDHNQVNYCGKANETFC